MSQCSYIIKVRAASAVFSPSKLSGFAPSFAYPLYEVIPYVLVGTFGPCLPKHLSNPHVTPATTTE
jgi:hypothetical protein